jgi:accessory gene regulator protein AgrB
MGISGILRFFGAKWQYEPFTSYYFLAAFLYFAVGLILMLAYAPYQTAIVVEGKLKKREKLN